MDRQFCLTDGDRGIAGDPRGGRQRRRQQFGRRKDFVHETPGVGFGCGKRLAGQDQFLGAALADGPGQGLRAAAARHDAERDLGQRKTRALGRVEKIAAACDLAAAAIGGTVYRADDRDRAVDQRPHHPLEDDVLARPCLVGHAAPLLQVAAGAERLVACACENDAAQVLRIERRILEIAHEVASHPGVECVGCLRPIEPDDRHMLIDRLDRKRLEGGRTRTHIASQENPLPLRRIFPTEGEGKCAVQHSVSVSQ